MEKSRQISPSTRRADSPYRIKIEGIKKTELLVVTITHKEIPSFKEIYKFDGNDLQGKESIHFNWDGEMVVWLGGIKPINKSIAKKSIHSCMNSFIALLAILFILSLGGCSKSTATPINETMNDLQKYNIKGNVSEIRVVTYEPINSANGIVAGEKQKYGENSLFKFNEHGYEYIVYREDGTSKFFLYDEDNKLTSQAEVSWDEKKNNYTINSEKKFRYANGFLCVDNYNDYIDGENILTVYCNDGDKITNTITYKSGAVSSETEYIYENGEKKEEIIHRYLNLRNGLVDTMIFHYFYQDGFVCKVKSSNRISEEIRNDKHDIVETINCKIAETNSTYNVPGHFLYEYEYDEHDNWIKRTEWKKMEDGTLTPLSITTRDITYRQ